MAIFGPMPWSQALSDEFKRAVEAEQFTDGLFPAIGKCRAGKFFA
jgi:hypothetical protein